MALTAAVEEIRKSYADQSLAEIDKEHLIRSIKSEIEKHEDVKGDFLNRLHHLKAVVNYLNDLVVELPADGGPQESSKKKFKNLFRTPSTKSQEPHNKKLVTPQELGDIIAGKIILFSESDFAPKKEIIDQLISRTTKNGESADPIPVFTLVEVAGIGKTELARLVFEDEAVKAHFGSLTWLQCTHQTFDVDSIAESVTESAGTYGKPFLIILDGLGSDDDKENLTKLLESLKPPGLSGGAILVITSSIIHTMIAATASSVEPNTQILKMVVKWRDVPGAIITLAGEQVADLNEDQLLLKLKCSYCKEELPTYRHIHTVGREKEKEEIIVQLISHTTKNGESAVPIPVFTIVGVAGIGKTKLARLVYEDEKVKTHFGSLTRVDDIREAFDVESIAKRVTDSAGTDKKLYLLVLDDLRVKIGEEALTALQNKLKEDGLSGGAILITTRSILVAKNIAATASLVEPYTLILKGLDDKDSWSLFQNITGQDANDIGRKMVVKCRGVPRAIINLAEEKVADLTVDQLLRKLTCSYCKEELPTYRHVQCFAYCSLFPEDYLFDTERLIHLWMGEGFLTPFTISQSKSDSSPEDIGRDYINHFLDKSIFQVVKEDECGVVRSCRMHRLMHDIARFVANDLKEGIIIDPDGKNVDKDVLRASFDFSLDVSRGIPDSMFQKAKNLRTILLAPTKPQPRLSHELKMRTLTCEKIFTTFQSLRVLDLHDLGIKTVSSSIGKLKNLRDLDLSQNNIEKLPGSIAMLSNLQTLKLSRCPLLKELPEEIGDLVRLRHLDIAGCLGLTHMPRTINKLTSLQTLSHFVASKGGLGELAGLNDMGGYLEIMHLERWNFSESDAVLKNKQRLQRLTLRWDHEDDQVQNDEEKSQPHPKWRALSICLRFKDGGQTSGSDQGDDQVRNDEEKSQKSHESGTKGGGQNDVAKESLDCLKPHSNLEVLFLEGYHGHTLSDWLLSIKKLVRLSLYDCPSCKFLPPLDKLRNLKILELLRLDSLEFIAGDSDNSTSAKTGDPSNEMQPSSSSSLPDTNPDGFFPSLKELTISNCPNLKSWWKRGKTGNDRSFFTRISKLQVQSCVQLTCMPLFPGIDEELVLVSSNVNLLEDTISDGTEGGNRPFSKLKSMQIASVEERYLLENGIENFVSLKNLHIRDCPRLKSLPKGFKHLSSLQNLTIEDCKELDLDCFGTEWEGEGLKNLRSLTIREIPKLKSLPLFFDKVTSLKNLELDNCLELESLPKSIGNLSFLGKLVISKCNKLASLPKELNKHESLHTLIILDCKLLLPRCQRETGDDWPQIKNIKQIQVKETQDLL